MCGQRVGLPPRGWRPGAPLYCDLHVSLIGVDPLVHGPLDLDRAIAELDRPATSLVQFPWRTLQGMFGPIVRGTVSYVAAFPKNGKTSFLAECITRWMAAGYKVYVLPLESRKDELYTRLACLRLGIDPDYALSKRMVLDADGGDGNARLQRDELKAEFRRWKDDPDMLELLPMDAAEVVTVEHLRKSMRAAHDIGADLVLVDHVDHVQSTDSSTEAAVQVSSRAQMVALECAKRYDLAVVLATQLNKKATGGDKLAIFRPPLTEWLWMPGIKQQIATRIVGLYRPQRPDADDASRFDVLDGRAPLMSLGHAGRMGIVDMSSRYSGNRVGTLGQLSYLNGTLEELSDRDHADDQVLRHYGPEDEHPSLRASRPTARGSRGNLRLNTAS